MPEKIQRSFTSGEISPSLQSRADTTKYATGLNLCKNFIVRAQGGVYSRPGTRFVGELGDSATTGRLIPFSFNTEQTYILVFQDQTLRIIKDGAFVLSGGGPAVFELATPYTEAQLPFIGFVQSADVMTLVHPDHDPRNLSRLADDNWSLDVIDYAPTLTAPVISSLTPVGAGAGTNNKNYTYVVTAVDADGVESLASASSTINTPSLGVTAGVRVTWGAVAGADYYRVYKDPSDATGFYGWIGDSNGTTFDDFNIAPLTSDAPPVDRQPFTGADNKPSAVTYYQQRQVFANTYNEPQVVYTSQTGVYNSLRTSNPARDDDAVTLTIAARQVNEIRHLVSLDSLILLTSGAEWIVSEGQENVLTPATAGVRAQSYNGASWVPPAVINSTVLYVQEKGARLRDLGYEFSSDKYTGSDLSIMAEHLFDGKQITAMAYADEPYGVLWCVRDDGVLLGLTYQREHQVWGWHQHDTAGEFESVAVISEDNRDAPYFIVKRTINGQTKRFVERMEPREKTNAEDCFYVDSGLSYDGAPATLISGLDHLEGEDVAVLADGNEVTGLTVSSGSITLPRAASKVHVGLSYTPVIELLDIDSSGEQSVKSRDVSVSTVTIEVEKSRGGFVAPRADAESGYTPTTYEIKPRFDADGYGTIGLRTFKQVLNIDPMWAKGGGIRIEQRSPLPLAVLSVIPQIDVGGNG